MTRSLRARLLAGVISAVTLLLIIFSLVIYASMRRTLLNQFDNSLASTAALLAASVEIDAGQIEMELDAREMPAFRAGRYPAYYQLWQTDGATALKSPALGAADLKPLKATLDRPAFRNFDIEPGRPARAVSFAFTPKLANADDHDAPEDDLQAADPPDSPPGPTQQQLTLAVAADASDLHYTLASLRWLLLVACAALITLSLLVAAIVVRRALRPLNSIAAEIAAVSEDNLAARIDTPRMPDEIIPIRDRLNDLLARLEASFARERRFTADVAHELRTPLAGLRSTIEVALSRNRNHDEYQHALSDCLAIASGMQAMVNNLLALARIETQSVTFRRDTINLADMVTSCWRPFSARAADKKLTFQNRLPAALTCSSDPDHLSMAVSNLLDNAVEYADHRGLVSVDGRKTNGSIEITFANTGCRLTTDQLPQAFDCFWRNDPARTNTANHCGLGLPLVKKIVTALGGRASAELQSDGMFSIRITLPPD